MTKKFEMDGRFLEQVAQEQKVELQPGDILVLRTGWLSWYKSFDDAGREALRGSLEPEEGGHACPGLDASQDTAAWLWDRKTAAIASDNVALEALPVDPAVGSSANAYAVK